MNKAQRNAVATAAGILGTSCRLDACGVSGLITDKRGRWLGQFWVGPRGGLKVLEYGLGKLDQRYFGAGAWAMLRCLS